MYMTMTEDECVLMHLEIYKPQLSITCTTSYLLFENFAFSGLWVSKVHDLIEQFVEQDKVVPDTLLLQLLKVLTEYL